MRLPFMPSPTFAYSSQATLALPIGRRPVIRDKTAFHRSPRNKWTHWLHSSSLMLRQHLISATFVGATDGC
jgi:hypothetical protein